MTTVQIDLPDQLAQEAKRAGLLSRESIEQLLREAVRRRALNDLRHYPYQSNFDSVVVLNPIPKSSCGRFRETGPLS